MLREAVALYKGQGKRRAVDWVKVSSYMGGIRSSNQCYGRWYFTLKLTWTEEEVISVIHATIIHMMD
jgi:hypothetical protein